MPRYHQDSVWLNSECRISGIRLHSESREPTRSPQLQSRSISSTALCLHHSVMMSRKGRRANCFPAHARRSVRSSFSLLSMCSYRPINSRLKAIRKTAFFGFSSAKERRTASVATPSVPPERCENGILQVWFSRAHFVNEIIYNSSRRTGIMSSV